MNAFYDALERNPIIAAIKTTSALEYALESPVEVFFLLGGNICELDKIVADVKGRDKKLYVHIDLIEGIGKDYYALKYLSERIAPHGIITTKSNLVKCAKEFGVFVIQRIFMLDSMAFDLSLNHLTSGKVVPDALEILPGILPGIITQFSAKTSLPVIAGGLIREKDDVIHGLNAGAIGVSTSCKSLWYM